MTSGQEMVQVYSYNPRGHTGWLTVCTDTVIFLQSIMTLNKGHTQCRTISALTISVTLAASFLVVWCNWWMALQIIVPRIQSQWCGLRPSVLWQDRSETKKSVLVLYAVVLVLQVWWYVVTLLAIMILKYMETFQVLFILFLIVSLCLLPVVLVLLLWSWT